MPRSNSPRHAARRFGANTPMMRDTQRRLALELRLAVESLIGAPSVDAYNVLSKMLAALRGAGVNEMALEPATLALNQVCDRFERIGRVGLSGDEAAVLRREAGNLERLLSRLPVNIFARAVAEVEIFCTEVADAPVPNGGTTRVAA